MQYLNEIFHAAWQDQDPFRKVDELEGEIYRAVASRRTLRFEHLGQNYFAKIHKGVGWLEIIKNLVLLRKPVLGAGEEWQAINKLTALGVETMTVAAYGMKGRNPARMSSFIITEALENTVSLEDYCRTWPESPPDRNLKLALIERVASISRTLHENGVNHRDYYICHFLLARDSIQEKSEYADLTLHLIDLHRSQIRSHTPFRWRVKDVSGLLFSAMDIGLTSRDLARFMRIYSGKSLRLTLQEETRFWNCVLQRASKMYLEDRSELPTSVIRWA
ncbi:MAG: lipopolysaccharide core heptose(I) kinase RfaP [Gammaproteobacteria bacterium]|nr:lipopolysaccharide core heptose(I) kinase RfaP [Gammaproteobacteria bacterium]